MKHNKEVLRRLASAENRLGATKQKKYILKDFDGKYYGDCGHGLTQEQFAGWVKQQDANSDFAIFAYPTIDAEGRLGE